MDDRRQPGEDAIVAAEAREFPRLHWPDCASEARRFVSLSV